jgi:hypothetical protein
MISSNTTKDLHGTNGGNVGVNPDLANTQISISGRATGTLTVTAMSVGSDVFEAFAVPLTIDLSVKRTVILEPASLKELSFAVSVAGSTFDVTISQWYTQ